MATVRDHFIDLEKHRRQLEQNVEKVQKALQHWRMADAEYEQLKDEVEALPPDATDHDLDAIKAGFEGEVVTEKDLDDLLGSGARSAARILSAITNRIDYVSKNVSTLEKQLENAENKLATATIVTNPDVRDEQGLPITDIIEELDDDDNITSYHLQQPGNLEPQIREALAKAGINDLPEKDQDAEQGPSQVKAVKDDSHASQAAPKQSPTHNNNEKASAVDHQKQQATEKKGVSFAQDTKPGHDATTEEPQVVPRNAKRLGEIMEKAKEQAIPAADPVIPDDESEDEAELRREMLRYGMTEIAPIVAELEIDEGGESDYDEGYSDVDYDDDGDEDEDEHGRAKYRVVDEDYRQRMLELEKKLGIKSTRELEQDDGEEEEIEGRVGTEGIARIAVQPAVPSKSAIKSNNSPTETNGPAPKPAKKGVQFADALDVAPDPTAPPPAAPAVEEDPDEPFVDPMKSTIVERSAAIKPAAPAAPEPKKTSRFKKTRAAAAAPPNKEGVADDTSPSRRQLPTTTVPKGPADAPARFLNHQGVRTAPAGPEGQTLAGAVVERDAPANVREPDEFDAALLHQEAAVEYHRVRNRMILKEGGFARDEEAEIEYPDEEEEEASGKRVSRFKAARLARQ